MSKGRRMKRFDSIAASPTLRWSVHKRRLLLAGAGLGLAPFAAMAQVKSSGNKPREPVRVSDAETLMDYRVDAASHLYRRYKEKLYHGRLPPLLYAIGVVEFTVNEDGSLADVGWIRAPRHAPEVMKAVIDMIKAAAPYPAPAKLGKISYMETWLWDKSGRWQIDILSEGQQDG
jgi:periplasmic protein TonB